MVSGIKGTIEELLPNEVYIETNSGLSYLIHISKNTFMKLKEVPENQVIKLRTEYIVSETSVKLFGFIVSSELTMFKMLIKLPKIGPTTALNICGEITLKDLYEMVTTKNLDKFKGIKGVGPKVATQIIQNLENKGLIKPIEEKEIETYKNVNYVKEALKSLGFLEKQFKEYLKDIKEEDSLEDSIRSIIQKIK